MSKYNILVKITGSIAAYKTAYLISKLVQNNYEVQVVVTKDALNFIGLATLEGLTGNQVYFDIYENSRMMSHINLVKWADLTILAPASANTINKLANGIGDNLLTSLFLAHNFEKPYLIAPAMNQNMFEHPSTKNSLSKLKEWGVEILQTQEGYLACGDFGKGKMLEPDLIFNFIENKLKPKKKSNKKIIITSGGTKEYIDGVRYLSNLSTGKTAAAIAQYFINSGFDVTFLHTFDSKLPDGNFESFNYTNFDSLNNFLKTLLSKNYYDLFIHNAAVSDYTVKEIIVDNESFEIPVKHKLPSQSAEMLLKLSPNFKIVNNIKNYSKNKNIKLIAFKFTNTENLLEINSKIMRLIKESNSDLVIQNDLSTRKENIQAGFNFYNKTGLTAKVNSASEIGESILNILKL